MHIDRIRKKFATNSSSTRYILLWDKPGPRRWGTPLDIRWTELV